MHESSRLLLEFALASLIIELTPGPNMGYLAALSVARGWRAGLAAVAGIALGLATYGAVAALGLGAIIEQSRFIYEALRWAGVAYMAWLAWEAWRTEADVSPETIEERGVRIRTAFTRGLVTNLLNPKAALFYAAVMPSFVVSTGNVVSQTLTLSAIYVSVATLIHVLVVLLASRLHGSLSDPARRRPARRVLALMLAGIAVWFAISTAR